MSVAQRATVSPVILQQNEPFAAAPARFLQQASQARHLPCRREWRATRSKPAR